MTRTFRTPSRIARSVLLLFLAAFTLTLIPAGAGQSAPVQAKPRPGPPAAPGPTKAAGPPSLIGVRLGTMADYSRLVFTLSQPVDNYTLRRTDADEVWLDFGQVLSQNQGRLQLKDALVDGVALAEEAGRLIAKIKLAPTRFNFRHFSSVQPPAIIVDFQPLTGGDEKAQDQILKIPTPQEAAQAARAGLPAQPRPGTDEALLAEAADQIVAGNYPAAVKALQTLRTTQPNSPLLDPGLFMLGDAYYHLNPDNPSPEFQNIASIYQEATNLFPKSPQVPRAYLMLGLAHYRMNFLAEALGFFKLLQKNFPQSPLSLIGQIYQGEIYTLLGKRDLAKEALNAVLAKHPKGDLVIEALFRLGQAYFQDGLFSQANEVFKEALNRDNEFYVRHPEILNLMGEGYSHLGRQDLARAYLFHSLNLNPNAPNADLLMARIGDAYKESGQDEQAIGIFTLTRQIYPGTSGDLISHMRLAEYGALRSLFKPEGIFRAVENGTQETILKMYKDIAETKQDSPLIQLALFRMGQAHFKQENWPAALEAFKTLLTKYPKSSLAAEARQYINKALVALTGDLYALKKYNELTALYNENKKLISEDNLPEVRHFLALTNAAQNLPSEAAALWESNKDYAEHGDERLFGLAQAYIQLGRYEEAIRTLAEFRKQFPNHKLANQALVDQARAELALGREDQALVHLEAAMAVDSSLAKDGQAQQLLSQLYLKRKDWDKALPALEKALAAYKGQPGREQDVFWLYARMGQVLIQQGRVEEALTAYDSAIRLSPQNPFPETLYLIANAYKQHGLPDKHKNVIETLKQTQDPFWRKVAEQELRALTPDREVQRILGSSTPSPAVNAAAYSAGGRTTGPEAARKPGP
ncbi:MAG: tetratricopeptide repeat protein [Thermodesulfobacteriota bacterium]